ncbi:MAG TPA: hypothetical protein VIV82_01180 [Verrucomicrobiae bacterium]
MSFFANAKDRLIEQGALSYLNTQILAPFGRATSLRLDTSARTLSVELELNGEVTPVKIEITDYELVQEADRYFLKVRHVQTSREWLTGLANARFCGQRIQIPEQAGRWLMRML